MGTGQARQEVARCDWCGQELPADEAEYQICKMCDALEGLETAYQRGVYTYTEARKLGAQIVGKYRPMDSQTYRFDRCKEILDRWHKAGKISLFTPGERVAKLLTEALPDFKLSRPTAEAFVYRWNEDAWDNSQSAAFQKGQAR